MTRRSTREIGSWNRRRWLKAVSALCLAGSVRAEAEDAETQVIETVQESARRVGLTGFEVSRTPRYLGIGNAPDSFRSAALALCEGLADDYLEHFRRHDLPAQPPSGRLGVVILADSPALARYLGVETTGGIPGIYDRDTNRLVMCDNRDGRNVMAERANTVTLLHEATHQLTFNTGLLDRQGDVPLLVSEGLGCYGEVRRPGGKVKVGAVNRERLAVLASLAARGGQLTPVQTLLLDENRFSEEETRVSAYSEAWLFIHMLMNNKSLTGAFRAYLDAIRPRRTAEHRLEDLEAHLGKPEELDAAMKNHANRLLRGK